MTVVAKVSAKVKPRLVFCWPCSGKGSVAYGSGKVVRCRICRGSGFRRRK